MKKYLVIGDCVYSENDMDLHFVDAPSLIRLYHLDPRECETASMNHPEKMLALDPGFIAVCPDSIGKYVIPSDAVPGQIIGDSWRAFQALIPRRYAPYPEKH